MALFAISDLHLSLGTDKPMDIFGTNWQDYESKLKNNWESIVNDDDVVILNGDNSWATYIQNAEADFYYINSLPGRKIMSKGNHDYWWTTMNKQVNFCREKGFNTISFLQNNHYMYGSVAICGTRGWQITKNDDEDKKIHNRELQRLELSLKSSASSNPDEIVAALHYPPDEKFVSLLVKYGVKTCVYGHLHGRAHKNAINNISCGIKFCLVSCDFLQFNPFKIL